MSAENKEKKEQLQAENEQVIKITYRRMIDLVQSGKLAQLEKMGLKTKISIWLGRVMDKFEDELQKTFNKKRTAIIEKYAVKDAVGNNIVKMDYGDGRKEYVVKEGMESVREKELNELLDYEVDVHLYRLTIKVSQLPETMQPSETRALDAIATLIDDSDEKKD